VDRLDNRAVDEEVDVTSDKEVVDTDAGPAFVQGRTEEHRLREAGRKIDSVVAHENESRPRADGLAGMLAGS
jgi:hypothetical protein